MATAVKPPRPEGPRRWRIASGVVLQILCALALLLMVNYLGMTRYGRWDLSRYNRYALSDLSRRVLGSLKKEVHVYFLFSSHQAAPGGAALFDEVRSLLREYEAVAKRNLRVETVDLYDDVTKGKLLQERFRFGTDRNVLILEYQNRSKLVRWNELADFAPEGLFGQEPQVKTFRGEQAITGALLSLVEENPPKVGLTVGHGELSGDVAVDGESVSRLRSLATRQNIQLLDVDLTRPPPDLASVRTLLIVGPRGDFSPAEIVVLQAFWNAQGRLGVLLNARAQTPNLDGFLAGLGVKVDTDLIVTRMRTGIEEEALTLDVYGRISPEIAFLKPVAQNTGFFPGGTRSVGVDAGALQTGGLRATAVLRPAFPDYWGETDGFLANGADPTFNPGRDRPPPLAFGYVLERGDISDQRVQGKSSRLLVIGNADFVQDASLSRAAPDVDLLALALNWLTDRERSLGIPPKEPHLYSLDFSAGQLNRVFVLVVLGAPALAGLASLFVFWVRRR